MPTTKNFEQYLYTINYPNYEESLCKMEMKYIFGDTPEEKHIFTQNYVDPSKSPFIKECIKIMFKAQTLEDLAKSIEENNLAYEKYKVRYVKHEKDDTIYEERLNALRKIGSSIIGTPEIHTPDNMLGITNIKGFWYFGEFEENKNICLLQNHKPYSYSNALTVRAARAIVNIAVGNINTCTVVDPCCGIGTVIIEALSQNLNIKGWEINSLIGMNAKRNLEFFNYKDVITIEDMHNISEHFDVAIIDLPYGLFNPITLKEQLDIITTARRIADKLLIVTMENMEEHIINAGFRIMDSCNLSKGKFVRYITLCN